MKYTTSGIQKDDQCQVEGFHLFDLDGTIIYEGSEIFYEIEHICITLYDKFTELIFSDLEEYYSIISYFPLWLGQAGIDSDCCFSKDEFDKLIQNSRNNDYNKELFLSDCNSLLSSLQNRINTSNSLFIQFYKFLCEINIEFHIENEGTYWMSGGRTDVVFSILNEIFSNSYAILDLLTKVAYQFENMPTDYTSWPKLKSLNIVYGDKHKIKNLNKKGTIFDDSTIIKTIISLRHELIHNSSWEPNPKIFYITKDQQVIEKFIFQPDINESGSLLKVRNRKHFFNNDIKINETLPNICIEFWHLVYNTLLNINRL